MEMPRREEPAQVKNIGITLSAEIIKALDVIGKAKDYSRSALVRYAIEKTFDIEDNIASGKFKMRSR